MEKMRKVRFYTVTIAALALAFMLAGCQSPNGGGDSESYVQYTVTFNANGGSVSPAQKKVLAGEAMEILPTPVKTGGDTVFAGWFSGNGTGGDWGDAFLASTPVTKDITVYAQWSAPAPLTFTVTFDATGGSVLPVQKKVLAGEAMEILPTPVKTGGDTVFEGWFSGNGTGGDWGDAFLASTPVAKDITVYARWSTPAPLTFTVTFNSNGGDTEASPGTKTVTGPATTIDALPTPPTRNGYTFAGWKSLDGQSFTADSPVTSTIVVYAQWSEGQLASGSLAITIGFEYGALTVTGSDGVNLLSKTLAGERPGSLTLSAAGYTAIKWYINGAATSETSGSLTINAADYAEQIHSLTFTGWKNGVFYSSEPIAFTVMP